MTRSADPDFWAKALRIAPPLTVDEAEIDLDLTKALQ